MYKYQHGGDIYSQKLAATGKPFVDFSANINPLGLPKGVKKAIVKSLKDCINYPDAFCRELAEATGEFLQVNKDIRILKHPLLRAHTNWHSSFH